VGAVRVEAAIGDLEQLCAAQLDHRQLQHEAAELFRRAVPFDVAVQASVDPASMIETSCVPIGIPPDSERERHVMWLEYASDDPLPYAEVASRRSRAAALRAEVQDVRQVRRFTEIGEPLGVFDELRAAFVADGLCWGTVTLYRTVAHPSFRDEEVAFFTSISATMARGLRGAFLRAAVDDVDHLADPPGHCTVSRSGDVITTTEAAERWLDTLGSADRLPAVLAALAAQLDAHAAPRATVVGTAGPITLHATPAKGVDDGAAAVIIEKPRPVHLTPLIMAAHGLTDRERDITELVLRGLVTKQIARQLEITEYTVQDHLKSIFAKVGVGTRGELAYELYARHYLPRTESGATPGPYGYYLGPRLLSPERGARDLADERSGRLTSHAKPGQPTGGV
jgi:DNA-binding CsgD family transcriptional regulator